MTPEQVRGLRFIKQRPNGQGEIMSNDLRSSIGLWGCLIMSNTSEGWIRWMWLVLATAYFIEQVMEHMRTMRELNKAHAAVETQEGTA
jgi:hypothetical protein